MIYKNRQNISVGPAFVQEGGSAEKMPVKFEDNISAKSCNERKNTL